MDIHSVINRTKRWIDHNIYRSNDGGDYSTRGMTEAQQRRLVGVGASGGAVVGGVAGGIVGFTSEAKDSVKEVWVGRDITDPKLTGWSHTHYELGHYETYYTTESYTDSNGHTQTHQVSHQRWHHDGWQHNYSPNIDWRKVGTYQEPTLQHSHPLNLLTGALAGAAIGAVAGTVLGVAAAALLHWARSAEPDPSQPPSASVRPGLQPPSSTAHGASPQRKQDDSVLERLLEKWRDAEPGTKLKASTTAAGAAIGGVAGYVAGSAQEARQVVITRTYPVPDLVSRNLGRIPNSFSTYDWGWHSWYPPSHPDGDHGWHDVHRDAPHYDPSGGVVMKSHTETLSSRQFGPIAGALGGVVIGAGLGFLSGIAIDVALHYKDAPEPPYH